MKKSIGKRISVRSYEKRSLSVEDMTKVLDILEFVGEKKGPFGHRVAFFFVDNKNKSGGKIGTYGFVKNPPTFVGGVVENTVEGMVDFGFLFEEVILRLTKIGLGTVWLGGTFTRSDFDVHVPEGSIIAAVSPVGYGTNQSFREKVVRHFAKANSRLPFDQLFFVGKELRHVGENHRYISYLEDIQLAPSASNKQPWRVVVIDDIFHFYIKRTDGYGNILKMDIQAIDIGIALSHLVLSLKEDGQCGEYIVRKPLELEGTEYIMSVKKNDVSTC